MNNYTTTIRLMLMSTTLMNFKFFPVTDTKTATVAAVVRCLELFCSLMRNRAGGSSTRLGQGRIQRTKSKMYVAITTHSSSDSGLQLSPLKQLELTLVLLYTSRSSSGMELEE